MRSLWLREAMTLARRKSEAEGGPLQVDELPMNSLPIRHQRRRGNDGEGKHISQEKKESPRLTTTYHYLTLLDTTLTARTQGNCIKISDRIAW